MFNHEPPGYRCPFCFLLAGGETEVNSQQDIVLRAELATALISPRWWPNNHVLVIPNAHHENLYDLPVEHGHAVHDVVREIAIAMRGAYGCQGVSTRQHNEPAQPRRLAPPRPRLPRYPDDHLYNSMPHTAFAPAEQRWSYAAKLRSHLTPVTSARTASPPTMTLDAKKQPGCRSS